MLELTTHSGRTCENCIGMMEVGDVDDDNMVDVTDYTMLRATFGRSQGEEG